MCDKYLFESTIHTDGKETEGPKIEVPLTMKQTYVLKGFMQKYGTNAYLYSMEEYNKHTYDFIMKIIDERMKKQNIYDPQQCITFTCPKTLQMEVEESKMEQQETKRTMYPISRQFSEQEGRQLEVSNQKPVYSFRINTKSGNLFFDFKSYNNAHSNDGHNEYIQITQSRKKKNEETYHCERIFIPRSDLQLLKEAILQAAEFYDKKSQTQSVSI